MSYYDTPSWQSGTARQASWDQPTPPSRSDDTSAASIREDASAFATQVEEIERAMDNLFKSGKFLPSTGSSGRMHASGGAGARHFNDFDSRMNATGRHPSMDFDSMRSHPASNMQSFYAQQRFHPRHHEADPLHHAKRRMAAARERELRNYHQEQQFHRNVSSHGKSERSMSPGAMNEEDRRDFVTRQHRAMYGGSQSAVAGPGEGPSLFEGSNSQTGRRASPRGFNSFSASNPNVATHTSLDDAGASTGSTPHLLGQRSRPSSTSPTTTHAHNYAFFEGKTNGNGSVPAPGTSHSSPGSKSPPRTAGLPPSANTSGKAPAPIGTRPLHAAAANRGPISINSPLTYGFGPLDKTVSVGSAAGTPTTSIPGDRAGAGSATPTTGKDSVNAAWGPASSNGNVWGKSNLSGVPASVWG